ncbi:hypothetical protein ILUMI_21228 [Ignelater luminosus]|uniref:Major facilitator superfamily (MFS) profile domain-containing protein n=1 Tax=Ignelater luminosus TaxID=2038154 RepID=A0A8K0CGV6_IGNLU|nr:hypothetical protein ILUMI_21228 [Ignelater luminosus]
MMTQSTNTKYRENGTRGNYYFQFLVMLTATLSSICGGMQHGWSSPSLPQLLSNTSTIQVTSEEGSWAAVMSLIGAVGGSPVAVLILDVIGRKKVILLSCMPHIIAWIMIAYAKSIETIFSARFIAGISNGLIVTTLIMYLGEIADPKVRGALCSSVPVTWIFGIFLINLIGSYLSIKTTALISLALPLLCLITFVWMPESPYYLIMKGNIQQASANLKTLKRMDNVRPDLEKMITAVKKQKENSGRYLDLFTVESHRKAFVIAIILRLTQQFSGISAITFYAQIIFEEAGSLSILSAREASLVYFAIEIILCVCCSMTVDRVGRRPLLVISLIGVGFSLLIEGSYFYLLDECNIDLNNFKWVPLVALIGYVIFFSLGMEPVLAAILSEIFPINVKPFALCLVEICCCLSATGASKFFQITKDSFGLYVPFFSFSVVAVLALIFIILFVPETKGKTLEEIQDELKGLKVKSDKECTEMLESFKIFPDL